MKTTISCITLLLLTIGINAQEIKTENHSTNANETADVTSKEAITDVSSTRALKTENTLEEDTCYSEISKATFYEALIRQNGLEIYLNNSDIVLKNTEDIITNNKDRISYTE
ncbi:hypothetical protein ATO12_11755 [Aquimarina atlantica]|uniref:Organic solvent tolerance-like N-terminal domain-containing protein n=1 Tax=Aquimarina atlantica TaxID=1317122 RepID=A0A023BXR7_9FLAO|nr:hypothetical protein [Aquimarina atlantica]EZH74438.1 hypothetical protein ATO12_11755 [Aquimarina atlantica]